MHILDKDPKPMMIRRPDQCLSRNTHESLWLCGGLWTFVFIKPPGASWSGSALGQHDNHNFVCHDLTGIGTFARI